MSTTLLSPLPSLRLSDHDIPPATATLCRWRPQPRPRPPKPRSFGTLARGPRDAGPPKPPTRYPFKPAVSSESGQVAQNLALNPHRPTLPPAHTPPAVSSFEAFRTPASVRPLAPLPGRAQEPLKVKG